MSRDAGDGGTSAERLALRPMILPRGAGLRRKAAVPPEARGEDYAKRYDWRTLFYDLFASPDLRRVIAVGPPLLNLRRVVEEGAWTVAGRPPEAVRVTPLDLCARTELEFDAPLPSEPLEAILRWGDLTLRQEIGRSRLDIFRGRDALFTLNRDNDLAWIRDWAAFHVREHRADAVLIFDNRSRRYESAELERTLASVPGLKRTCVIPAPFRYGPPGGPTRPPPGIAPGSPGGWRSVFLQSGLHEIARLRLLGAAAGVLNADIDELVWAESGVSVFDEARARPARALRYSGVWVYADDPARPGLRHRDHCLLCPGDHKAEPKWCVVPSGPMGGSQWRVHFLGSGPQTDFDLNAPRFWHFRNLGGWYYDRNAVDALKLEPYGRLRRAMARAFGAPPSGRTRLMARLRQMVSIAGRGRAL